MPIEHFPRSMRPGLRRLREVLRTDKGAVAILAVVAASRVIGYCLDEKSALQHLLELDQDWVSPLLWMTVTALLVAALVMDCHRMEAIALSASVAVIVLWGILFAWSGPAALLGRGAVYIGLAAVVVWSVWRGHAGEIRIRGDGAND